jgi:hypothetical protein
VLECGDGDASRLPASRPGSRRTPFHGSAACRCWRACVAGERFRPGAALVPIADRRGDASNSSPIRPVVRRENPTQPAQKLLHSGTDARFASVSKLSSPRLKM